MTNKRKNEVPSLQGAGEWVIFNRNAQRKCTKREIPFAVPRENNILDYGGVIINLKGHVHLAKVEQETENC